MANFQINEVTVDELSPELRSRIDKIKEIEDNRQLKTYYHFSALGLGSNEDFVLIAKAMPNNSSYVFSNYATLPWFPPEVTGDRNDIEITRYGGGINYIKVWLRNVNAGVFSGYYTETTGLVWKKLTTTDMVFGVKNPTYKENIDELFTAGQYILQSPFSGTMPNGITTDTAQWSILNVYGGGNGTGQVYQDLTTTNHSAFATSANRYFRRIRFGSKWSDWKELGTTAKVNNVTLIGGWQKVREPILTVSGNMVSLNLVINNGVATQGQTIASFDKIYAPKQSEPRIVQSRQVTSGDYYNGQIYINTDGTVQAQDKIYNHLLVIDVTWQI